MEMDVPPIHRADTVCKDRRPDLLLGAMQREKGARVDAERGQILVGALTGAVATMAADTIEAVVGDNEESALVVVSHRQFDLLRGVPAIAPGIEEVADTEASVLVLPDFVAAVAGKVGERATEPLKVLLRFP